MIEFTDINQVNSLIAERIFGWTRLPGSAVRYVKPDVESGFAESCPNFLESSRAQEMLRCEMQTRGWTLALELISSNAEAGIGKSTTAVFAGIGRSYGCTHPFENEAVCIAALKTVEINLRALPAEDAEPNR